MCYIFNLWDTQTLTKKTCRRKNVNFCAFPVFEGSILFLISLPVFNAAFVRGEALFSLHCYACISGRGWVQETAGMCSLPRHFGNCQKCAANGGYEATMTFFFWDARMNSTGEHMGSTSINKTCLYFIAAQNYLLCFSESQVQGGFCSSLFPLPLCPSFLVLHGFL